MFVPQWRTRRDPNVTGEANLFSGFLIRCVVSEFRIAARTLPCGTGGSFKNKTVNLAPSEDTGGAEG